MTPAPSPATPTGQAAASSPIASRPRSTRRRRRSFAPSAGSAADTAGTPRTSCGECEDALDRLAGGPGLGRGRRDPTAVRFGDALDFWRVTAVEPEHRLELRAEMKLPGQASLEFLIEPIEASGRSRLRQQARFKPKGAPGPRLLVRGPALPRAGLQEPPPRHPARGRGSTGGRRLTARAPADPSRAFAAPDIRSYFL